MNTLFRTLGVATVLTALGTSPGATIAGPMLPRVQVLSDPTNSKLYPGASDVLFLLDQHAVVSDTLPESAATLSVFLSLCAWAVGLERASGTTASPQICDKDCTVKRNVFAGGKVDYVAVCSGLTSTITGTYGDTSFAIDSHMQGNANGQHVDIKSHTTGKRIGATCKAGD